MSLDNNTFWDNLAVETYKKILKTQPNNPVLISNLGLAYRRIGLPKKAIAAFRKTIRTKKDHQEAYYHLAVTLRDNGQEEAAKTAFAKYEKLEKNS